MTKKIKLIIALLVVCTPIFSSDVDVSATPQSMSKVAIAAIIGASVYIGNKVLKVISEDEKKIKNTISDLSYKGISVKRESIGGKTYGITYFIKCWGELYTMNRNEKEVNRLHWLCIKKDLMIGLALIGLSSALRMSYDGLKNPA